MAASTLKPVYALVGSDGFLQLQKLAAISASLGKGVQRSNIDGERAELAEVFDELRSFAMFGDGKLVVISSADKFLERFRSQLEEYVAHPSNSSVLVLRFEKLPANQRIYKAIAKCGKIEPCEPPRDVAGWIIAHAKSAHQLTVGRDAAVLLAELLGNDLGRIDSELGKLALSATGQKLEPKHITGAVAFSREQEMSELVSAMSTGQTATAVRKWRQLVQSDSSAEFRAVTWLTIWLTNIRRAVQMKKQGMPPAAVANALRRWPAENVQPVLENAATLGEAGVNRAIDALAEIDRQSKTGIGDAATNVERFILSAFSAA